MAADENMCWMRRDWVPASRGRRQAGLTGAGLVGAGEGGAGVKFRRGLYRINCKTSALGQWWEEVNGWLYGEYLAFRMNPFTGRYEITHRPTGLRCGPGLTSGERTRQLVRALAVLDWNFDKPDGVLKIRDKAKSIIEKYSAGAAGERGALVTGGPTQPPPGA